ncbi:phosphoribosylamine--glycine ligase [Membranicola marinus]|uniref:Phosphoribosylamine--glycine ligase n=1 Tax=Membranihabitans marinus TaxID=1227546 RepID=A0A953HS94_9BACT|nr:phosphoribosylamine--glycine ligase [Membranihabitans marinus]MBY5956973.1 phosphoribosylamine--glycine ligase [Membranihabitans marinus]
MNILLLGSGGREHTLAWKITQSPRCDQLYVAPGNAGTGSIAENIAVDIMDFEALKESVKTYNIDFVIVGPEAPLVEGIVDYFQNDPELRTIPVLGPDRMASQLEGSKSYAKSFMKRHNIPTAGYIEVTAENLDQGVRFMAGLQPPYVLKADGLAAGKGVLIIEDLDEAVRELKLMVDGKFGSASQKVVIEEFLDGIEFSVFALTDGKNYILLPEAKDYKRIGEGDTGLNTGGMGSVSPVSFFQGDFKKKVIQKIVAPTIEGIHQDSLHYTGFVFFGLIKVQGEPHVIEYNCRMGDPETQSVLCRIEDDLVDVFYQAACQSLEAQSLSFNPETACTVVTVSDGYPGAYQKGKVIEGLEDVADHVFHAGTRHSEGGVLTNGGRVLAVTAMDEIPARAMEKAREAAGKIQYEGVYFRNDIGQDLLELSEE